MPPEATGSGVLNVPDVAENVVNAPAAGVDWPTGALFSDPPVSVAPVSVGLVASTRLPEPVLVSDRSATAGCVHVAAPKEVDDDSHVCDAHENVGRWLGTNTPAAVMVPMA